MTGRHIESHGLVANTFYDADTNDTFKYWIPENQNNDKWWIEPLWKTASKQGCECLTS